ncbi:MAG: dynamin family protein [Vicinamibacteraceae bacterium]
MSFGASRLLTPAAERQLVDVRQHLAQLRDLLVALPATAADLEALVASIRQLDELFMIVVVGEFNAGKSAFVNALLGEHVFEEGVTPTTARIQLIRHGSAVASSDDESGTQVVTAPVELLRDLQIVDTPGTNAIHREHERLTREFVPRADLVLFVTSADRPFTESERAFLETIRDWGKKIVVLVNKADIFESEAELSQVLAFVDQASSQLLGAATQRFAISARRAWRAKHGDPEHWAASGFGPLEAFLSDTLDDAERFRLKLANPLGVGTALAARYEAVAAVRLSVLSADVETLDAATRQLFLYGEDLERGFELRMTAVEKALVEMEARGQAFLDDTLRIGRVFDLLNRSRIQREFEERVVGDAPVIVERRVSELIDWLVDQDLRQWQALASQLAQRRQEHGARLLGGEDAGAFQTDRRGLLDSVGRQAQRVVETFDRRAEAQSLADGARTAVAATAAMGASALGLGALVTVVATTAAADVSGILAASVLGAVGMLILPAKRRSARAELERKVADLRQRLTTALRSEFVTARDRSAQRLTDGIAPYSRFVRAEQGKWTGARIALEAWRGRSAVLPNRVAPFGS